jgi:aryl-alcohol dehydrogenase-like predicted oxidoreductase
MCLGTMGFGTSATPAVARRLLEVFAEHGGNFVDAANTFGDGEGERILGEAVRGHRRRFVIGTKFGRTTDPSDPNAAGTTRKNLRHALDESLARLRTDYVDILWAHAWDPATPSEELARALEDAVRSGKALHVGIADAPAWAIARVHTLAECQRSFRVDGVLLEYGLAARDAERELLPMAAELGMTPLAWGTLAGDLLLGDPEAARVRVDSSGDYYARRRGTAALRVATVLRAIADALGVGAAAVALAWIRLGVPSVIPVLGPRTEDELRERIGSLDLRLDADQLRALDDASRIDLGFPSEYLRDPSVIREIYG